MTSICNCFYSKSTEDLPRHNISEGEASSIELPNLNGDQTQSYFPLSVLSDELIEEIFQRCLPSEVSKGPLAWSFTNKRFYKLIPSYFNRIDLKQLCTKLSILDAKALGFNIDDEPCIDHFALFKSCIDMIPHVQNDEGLSLLTLPKNMGLEQIEAYAKKTNVKVRRKCLNEPICGQSKKCCSIRVLISNNMLKYPFKDIRSLKSLVDRIKCEIPSIREYIALYVFQKSVFNKHVFVSGIAGLTSSYIYEGDDDCNYEREIIIEAPILNKLYMSLLLDTAQNVNIGVWGMRTFRSKPCQHSNLCTIL